MAPRCGVRPRPRPAGRLIREGSDPRTVSGITRTYLPGAPVYLAATLLALASPLAGVALYAASASST